MRTITPEVWGGSVWRTMHVVALGFPFNASEDVKKQYAAFYNSFKTTLPCIICRQGYVSIIEAHPVENALGNPEDLFNWTVMVHNMVNEKLGKLPVTPDYVKSVYIFGGPQAAAPDPAVDRANLSALLVYGIVFIIVLLAAYGTYLLFRH